MKTSLVLCLLSALLISTVTNSASVPSSCVACNKVRSCPDVSTCRSGSVDDICGCCSNGVCAKGEDEPCGGIWDYAGTCAAGLKCVRISKRFMQIAGTCKRI